MPSPAPATSTADGYNAFLSLEWRHQDPIYLANRSGLWNNLNWTPYGGVEPDARGSGSAYAGPGGRFIRPP